MSAGAQPGEPQRSREGIRSRTSPRSAPHGHQLSRPKAQLVCVRLHKIKNLGVATRKTEFDLRLGMADQQPASLLEDPVLFGGDQLTHINVWRQGVRSSDGGDFGVDVFHLQLMGQRDRDGVRRSRSTSHPPHTLRSLAPPQSETLRNDRDGRTVQKGAVETVCRSQPTDPPSR
jgi:hypothetical protein